jgi:hypothetical protein
VCFTSVMWGKIKKKAEEWLGGRPKVIGTTAVPNSVSWTGTGG